MLPELRHQGTTDFSLGTAYLRAVLIGHFRYYGVPMNGPALSSFCGAVGRMWWSTLRRRSRRPLSWRRLRQHIQRWFPRSVFVIPIRSSACALSPKAGAGCVSSARPDLRRGSRAIATPTPTGPQALPD